MKKNPTTGKALTRTGFPHGGRVAGSGVWYDDYSEESGNPSFGAGHVSVRLPHDGEKTENLNGECVIVKRGNHG